MTSHERRHQLDIVTEELARAHERSGVGALAGVGTTELEVNSDDMRVVLEYIVTELSALERIVRSLAISIDSLEAREIH